jgi:hypothetical protein
MNRKDILTNAANVCIAESSRESRHARDWYELEFTSAVSGHGGDRRIFQNRRRNAQALSAAYAQSAVYYINRI